jgi:hypothetical protein
MPRALLAGRQPAAAAAAAFAVQLTVVRSVVTLGQVANRATVELPFVPLPGTELEQSHFVELSSSLSMCR